MEGGLEVRNWVSGYGDGDVAVELVSIVVFN